MTTTLKIGWPQIFHYKQVIKYKKNNQNFAFKHQNVEFKFRTNGSNIIFHAFLLKENKKYNNHRTHFRRKIKKTNLMQINYLGHRKSIR